mgnify:FL=1
MNEGTPRKQPKSDGLKMGTNEPIIFYGDTETVTIDPTKMGEYQIPERLRELANTYCETAGNYKNTPFVLPHMFQVTDGKGFRGVYNTVVDYVNAIRDRIVEQNKRNAIIYFHNMKFDAYNILYALLMLGYIHTDDIKQLVIQDSSWYTFRLNYRGISLEFRDSYKLISQPLKSFQKTFGLSIGKSTEDSWKDRLDEVATVNALLNRTEPGLMEYALLDVDVLQAGLDKFWELQGGKKASKLTAASLAYSEWLSVIEEHGYRTADGVHHEGFIKEEKKKKLTIVMDNDMPKFIHDMTNYTYRGAVCYPNPDYTNKTLKGIYVYIDANSLYPSAMLPSVRGRNCYNQKELTHYYPVGVPVRLKSMPTEEIMKDRRYVSFLKLRIKAKIKPDAVIPFVSLGRQGRVGKGFNRLYRTNDFLREIDETFWVTSIDYRSIQNYYEIEEQEFIEGIIYTPKNTSCEIFNEYISKWRAIKEQAARDKNNGLKQLAKIMLNSPYGKFAQSIDNVETFFEFGENGSLRVSEGSFDGKTSLKNMGIAAMITSYAREILLDVANLLSPDEFLYCDTDSIIMTESGWRKIREVKGLLDKAEFGCWDVEHIVKEVKILHQKCYMITEFEAFQRDHKRERTVVKCAGASEDIKRYIRYDNFNRGETIKGARMKKAKQTIGGIALESRPFSIKAEYR